MKYKSESIDRLDGDIYEMFNGSKIDISKILEVSPIAIQVGGALSFFDIVYLKRRFFVNKKIYTRYFSFSNLYDEYTKFIEVWKYWKSIN